MVRVLRTNKLAVHPPIVLVSSVVADKRLMKCAASLVDVWVVQVTVPSRFVFTHNMKAFRKLCLL